MKTVLEQLNALQGVVGCMVFDPEGRVLGHAFPPIFDAEALRGAAAFLANGAAGLETATGKIGTMDLRFGESRMVVRPITGATLFMLCTSQANLQFLNISVAVAIPKLEKLAAAVPPPAPAASRPTPAAAKPPTPAGPEGKGEELKGFEKAFLKMDTWLRKQSGE
ncbi:MAG: roadblock/LC7 domain-containing protein [Acidobacteria bacterium]|nr:roadblock/LC7 domain-containing protein [Acidobacteriota bacterium]